MHIYNFSIADGTKFHIGACVPANRATKIASTLAPTINDYHLLRTYKYINNDSPVIFNFYGTISQEPVLSNFL